jgi:hypothetical protein
MAITEVHFYFGNHLERFAGHAVPLFCIDVPKQAEQLFTGGGVGVN